MFRCPGESQRPPVPEDLGGHREEAGLPCKGMKFKQHGRDGSAFHAGRGGRWTGARLGDQCEGPGHILLGRSPDPGQEDSRAVGGPERWCGKRNGQDSVTWGTRRLRGG